MINSRIHRGTLAVLHRLVHDRELQLYDGTRLVSETKYEQMKEANGFYDEEMKVKSIFPIKDSFRIVALAEPPVVGGSAKEQWLTPEILSMFFFHVMRPLDRLEEKGVVRTLTGTPSQTLEDVLTLTHQLRMSDDSALRSIANSMSTRQLLRIARRMNEFEGETVYNAVQKACLARFLPSLPREALEKQMEDMGIRKPEKLTGK